MSAQALSASGARIRGDDYQHLFAWCQVLRALQSGSDIIAVGIEDPDPATCNADDVTVYHREERDEFYQVKSSVDAHALANCAWLTNPSRTGGPSMLQQLHKAWQALSRNRNRPRLAIVTNRLVDHTDPILVLRDGRDGSIARQLETLAQRSSGGKKRRELAAHLYVSETDLIEFFQDVQFTLGKLHGEWEEHAALLMYALGLRFDDRALKAGVSTVRQWVTGAKRRLTVEEIRHEVDHLDLQAGQPAAILLVQALEYDPLPEGATVALNWVDLYQGEEPRTRRKLYDNRLWNERLRPEVQHAVRQLRAQGYRRVLVRGYMRLPSWFTIGTELGKTAGFEVISFQGEQEWASNGEYGDFPVSVTRDEILRGRSNDLALGVSLATDLSEDVLSYLGSAIPSVGRYINLAPTSGPSNSAIHNSTEARGWALKTRDLVRCIVREHKPEKLHLFLAAPKSAVLLLGHLWDRLPYTQLYEDQGVSAGYLPSFLIPN
jgi:hypothetical protein